ncbi:MAG: transposase, partial [Desulfurispora sp.]|uniref:transposase n=1 Tax=Desulfurispora sp. TaxID=3014275 RepID=UPI00404956AE
CGSILFAHSGSILLTINTDRGYDTDQIMEYLNTVQANAVIPSRKHRKVQRHTDWHLFIERHLVECFFNKLKHFRRLATRYDKKVSSFLAFLNLASAMLWLR